MDFTENRTMLGIMAIVLILFAVAVYFYNTTLNSLAAGSCTDASVDCPHEKIVETQNIVIAVLILVIGAVVAWIFMQMKKRPLAAPEKERSHEPAMGGAPRKIDASRLGLDERKVVEVLNDGEGAAFQSDIIKKVGYSKVKVSRILDRMEQNGIVERKRRGMANLVVLK